MKKLVLLFFLFCSVMVYGQERMKFNGLELSGHKSVFLGLLREKMVVRNGFSDDCQCDFMSYFAGFQCDITIESSVITDTVYGVIVDVWGDDICYLLRCYEDKYGDFDNIELVGDNMIQKWHIGDYGVIGLLYDDTVGHIRIWYEDIIGSRLDAEERERLREDNFMRLYSLAIEVI